MVKPSRLKNQPRKNRIQTYLTNDELKQFKAIVDQSGMKKSPFLRSIALAIPIRPKRSNQAEELVRELNKLGADINRVGSNINQLSRHANTHGRIDDTQRLEAILEELRSAVAEIVEAIKKV